MANQKSTIHDIALGTKNLNLTKYKHSISNYDGFNKNNSPYYGGVLSNFYHKKASVISNKSYVYNDGSIYELNENDKKLHLKNNNQDVELYNLEDSLFLTKEEIIKPKDTDFNELVGFVKNTDGTLNEICYNNEQSIFETDGTNSIKIYDSYNPSLVNHFYEKNENFITFGFGNIIGVYDYQAQETYVSEYSNVLDCKMSCIKTDNGFIYCRYDVESKTSQVLLFDFTSKTFISDISVSVTVDENTINIAQESFPNYLLFNSRGNILFSKIKAYIHNTSYDLYFCGKDLSISSVSGTTATLSVICSNENKINISDLNADKFELLSLTFDNNTLFGIIGWSNGGYDKTETTTEWKQEAITSIQVMSVPDGFGGYTTFNVPVVVGFNYYPVTNTKTTHYPGNYKVLLFNVDEQIFYENIPVSSDGKYEGGLCSNINDKWRLLYNNMELQGVSSFSSTSSVGTLLNTLGEIDSNYCVVYGTHDDEDYILFRNSKNWVKITCTSDITESKIYTSNNRYLIINTTSYYNCYDMLNNVWYHYASDWNDRCVFTSEHTFSDIPNTFSAYLNRCVQYTYASSQNQNYIASSIPFISTLFNSNVGFIPSGSYNIKPIAMSGETLNEQDIDTYGSFVADDSTIPSYLYSIGLNNQPYINSTLQGTSYTNNSILLIPSIFAEYIYTYTNQGIVIDNNKSYMQVYSESTKPMFAIQFSSALEGVKNAFVVQGQFYVIIDDSIYRYYSENSAISFVINIGNMKFIGFTPYQAIFFSNINKTFYSFTGDNILNPLVQANEIDKIIYTNYNPTTTSIYVITDKYVYMFSDTQLIKLELENYKKAYSIYSGAVFISDVDVVYISYNKEEGYTKLPIILQTRFYGLGNSVKSVNDCVYIRLFDEDKSEGKLKLKCTSINEGVFKSETKEFNIASSMWDKDSNTLFIRYQPQLQSCTGFSVDIESPFNIATLQISESIETVQNSKYNI